MVSREIEFAAGGFLVLTSLIPLAIAIIQNISVLNIGLLINIGGLGLCIGFAGFYLMGSALFRTGTDR